jgi:hypothetical protein
MSKKKRMVVVTTDKDRRGVFFGEYVSQQKDIVVLTNARMAIYWPQGVKGVLGLASVGPLDGSRISPVVPRIKLNGVTAIIDCTQEASTLWKAGPWT